MNILHILNIFAANGLLIAGHHISINYPYKSNYLTVTYYTSSQTLNFNA